uniref:Cytochrome c biogenesis protein CcsA n=1 Tax=Chlamydomonas leiostraca TaxID=1034604 RepID=A0A1L2M5C1_9CHLO|nr:cytochrome c biogenesis protein [Chlamydomonas leiostraca]APD80644.1 cytochrome c biogenesis protein [Chlamydomonas leiostraca]
MNAQNYLGNLSFLSLFASMIFYWVGILFDDFKPLGRPALRAPKETACPSGPDSVPSLAQGTEGEKTALFGPTGPLQAQAGESSFLKLGRYGIILSNIVLGLLLLVRWKESGHFPLSNLYESLMFLSWAFTTLHLFFFKETAAYGPGPTAARRAFDGESTNAGNRVSGSTSSILPQFVLSDKFLGAITTPSALFTNAFATFTLPKEMQEAAPLVPALQSNWLMMHVTVMILSYAALILGSLLALAFLIITFQNVECPLRGPKEIPLTEGIAFNENFTMDKNLTPTLIPGNGSAIDFVDTPGKEFSPKAPFPSGEAAWGNPGCPPEGGHRDLAKRELAFILDGLSYRILGIGFPFLTIGILSGAVWANEAWGSYWSWDPKETWALLTWLIFAIYLHTRLNKGWEGKKPAIIASFGFVVVWICYLGVNLIGEGLHSYGWLSA